MPRPPSRRRAIAIAHMKSLVAAGALLQACHRGGDLERMPQPEPPEYGGHGVDPVVPPPHASDVAKGVRAEVTWLNGRQLVVHLVAPDDAMFAAHPKIASADMSAGAVPHLTPPPAGPASPPASIAPPPRANEAPSPRAIVDAPDDVTPDKWILLQNLGGATSVDIEVRLLNRIGQDGGAVVHLLFPDGPGGPVSTSVELL